MTDALSIALCQIAPTVGDISGNLDKIRAAYSVAVEQDADLAVFCELVISGYPPEDLVQKPAYQDACRAGVEALAGETVKGGPGLIVGAPWRDGGALYNAAFLLADGEIKAIRYKVRLPNYGVFDEPRRFTPGPTYPAPVDFRGIRLGLMICEDMWLPGAGEALVAGGADILIVPHGSPFRVSALQERALAARDRVHATGLPLIFVNQLGGQDEVVFDGASFVMTKTGEVAWCAVQFEPIVSLLSWEKISNEWRCTDGPSATWPVDEEAIYRAVTLGVRDYVEKNRFPGVFIGLSGGIDSAITAAIAVDALGPDRVRCIMMPSRYTAEQSLIDAKACAEMLGVSYEVIEIKPAIDAMAHMLSPSFSGQDEDTTEENIQSRIRGVILMALSNKFGHMVLTTGNKSEMAIGYATLYGDMNGGYNPLKDIYKTDIYRLARWRNDALPAGAKGPAGIVIPKSILEKAPSAELRADQTDQDNLPPYDVLDDILEHLVEGEMAVAEIVLKGHDEALVRRIEHLVYVAEFKRRQAPPGPKITRMNFGRDRRYPITNGWRDRD